MKNWLKNLSSHKRGRLRDLFQIAMMIETQAKSFYEDILENVETPETKEFIQWLIEEEHRHRDVIYDIIERWHFRPVSPTALDRVDNDLKHLGIFRNPPEDDGLDSWMEYALDQEKKMVDFYSAFSDEFSSVWKKKKLEKLIDEEMSHVNSIQEKISQLP